LKQTAFGHRLKSRNFERCFGLEESDWSYSCEVNEDNLELSNIESFII
jgi:hypothetical protein